MARLLSMPRTKFSLCALLIKRVGSCTEHAHYFMAKYMYVQINSSMAVSCRSLWRLAGVVGGGRALSTSSARPRERVFVVGVGMTKVYREKEREFLGGLVV